MTASESPARRRARVFGLDVMRAVAISGVLAGHFGYVAAQGEGRDFLRFLFGVFGGVGVEIFFVLSGFLIAGLLEKIMRAGRWRVDAPVFLVRRWMRTLPLYYVCLSLYLTVPFFAHKAREDSWRYVVFLQNVTDQPGFFNISWSLSIEEWFYLAATGLAALASFLFSGLSPGRRLLLMAIGFWGSSFVIRLIGVENGVDANAMRLGLIFRFDVIAIGVLGYVFRDRLARIPRTPGLLASVMLIGLAVANGKETVIGMQATLFIAHVLLQPMIGLACLPALGAFSAWREPPRLWGGFAAATVRRQADLAYALYLFHWPVMALARNAMRGPGHEEPVTFVAFGLAMSYAVAYAMHKAVEKPIMDLRPKQPVDATRRPNI